MKKGTVLSTSIEQIALETPAGKLILSAENGAITAISLAKETDMPLPSTSQNESVLRWAAKELLEYFDGTRNSFAFPMKAQGTPFQKSVWGALLQIPYGETRSYGEIAQAVQNPKGSRAVGMACNKNPIMIAVPCHRVVGANGSLTGYALGTDLKKTLLDHEKRTK